MELIFSKGMPPKSVPLRLDTFDLREELALINQDNAVKIAQAKSSVPELAGLLRMQQDEPDKFALAMSEMEPSEMRRFFELNQQFSRMNAQYTLAFAQAIIDTEKVFNEDHRKLIESNLDSEFWRWQDMRELTKAVNDFRSGS